MSAVPNWKIYYDFYATPEKQTGIKVIKGFGALFPSCQYRPKETKEIQHAKYKLQMQFCAVVQIVCP